MLQKSRWDPALGADAAGSQCLADQAIQVQGSGNFPAQLDTVSGRAVDVEGQVVSGKGWGFAVAGGNEASVQLYREWASEWPGLLRLSASALILLAHFGLSTVGFALTGRALLRGGPGVPA